MSGKRVRGIAALCALVGVATVGVVTLGGAGCSGSEEQRREDVYIGPPPVIAPEETKGPALTVEQIEDIERTINVGREAVIKCYEDEMGRRGTRNFSGKVMVQFHITRAGAVRDAAITTSTFKDADQMHDCIMASLRTWEFPELSNDAPYSTTFDLSPAY